jgi:hypothetical protein
LQELESKSKNQHATLQVRFKSNIARLLISMSAVQPVLALTEKITKTKTFTKVLAIKYC